ncbi:MAG: hypothetical protein LRY73_00815 [Bacillus sp. (in: Bacteria)]|nr:hypothetical protein [Bacillus sp. (in: firmicutes)]
MVDWDIDSPRVEKALNTKGQASSRERYPIILSATDNGKSPRQIQENISREEKGYFIAVPTNIHEMKQASPESARAWRFAVRKAVTEAFQQGFVITGVKRDPSSVNHYYILEKTP